MTVTLPAIHTLGDSAITVTLAETACPESTLFARNTAAAIRKAGIPHVEEVVAAYTTLTVFYDSLRASYADVVKQIRAALDKPSETSGSAAASTLHLIRVAYEGPDLDDVAAATGLSREKVIEIHSSGTYNVDLLGFVPGFAYLSEVDSRLELPRRSQPRPRVPAGSVAIASRLTGIYPFDTPGGWHILGHTTAVMFDPRRAKPSLFEPGDTVKFEVMR